MTLNPHSTMRIDRDGQVCLRAVSHKQQAEVVKIGR